MVKEIALYCVVLIFTIVPIFRELRKPKRNLGYIAFLVIFTALILWLGIDKIISDSTARLDDANKRADERLSDANKRPRKDWMTQTKELRKG